MKITEVLAARMSFSFEVFPPKTDAGMANLKEALPHFYEFAPDFISCTYGAGGSNVGRNVEVCELIKADGATEVMTHFTCIGNTRDKISEELRHYRLLGIENILAMRGDLPAGWTGTQGDFSNADGLISYIKREFPDFCIAAACYPEKHILAPSFSSDIAHLRSKQDNGAEFLLSQLCHDVEAYKSFVDRIRKAGVTIPVIVGVMPVLSKDAIIRMTLSNGCSIPPRPRCRYRQIWRRTRRLQGGRHRIHRQPDLRVHGSRHRRPPHLYLEQVRGCRNDHGRLWDPQRCIAVQGAAGL